MSAPSPSSSLLPPVDDINVGIVDDNIQNVFDLLVARSHGETSNKDVEAAVSQLLSGGSGPGAVVGSVDAVDDTKKINNNKNNKKCTVQADEDDYDDETDSTSAAPPPQPVNTKQNDSASVEETKKNVTWTGPMATVQDLANDDDGYDNDNASKLNHLYDKIPLGREGAKMMVTFGDGPSPNPQALEACLCGTRRLLQCAIQDARGLRRAMKRNYMQAKQSIRKVKKSKQVTGSMMNDNVYLFRALENNDSLAYDLKCGFDVEQLQELFPEQMNAYNRWSQMHSEYEQRSKDEAAAAAAAAAKGGASSVLEDDATTPREDEKTSLDADLVGGHMKERAANFDVRTHDMNNDWYLEFATVRRGGSFLPRRSKASNMEERAWNEHVSEFGRGRSKDGTWDSMNIITVKFLHWIGFDPQSALPPPKEDTTEALGFLGHDFMGRIVELALQHRLKHEHQHQQSGSKLELPPGEQLKLEDIKKSLQDPSNHPISLYSASHPSSNGRGGRRTIVPAQLYFGPGFEKRIEMEMEELLESSKKRKHLPDEELEIRKREDKLFAELAKPPKLLNLSVNNNDDDDDNNNSNNNNNCENTNPSNNDTNNTSKDDNEERTGEGE